MRLVGVIAEYNPFHQGHAYHLAEAKRRAGADYAVAVMSSCFTQRGEAALVSPSGRAEMALLGGADAAIALPAMWSVRDAEHFALGGVSLMQRAGVDCLAFGAENDDLPGMQALAQAMENPSPAMLAAIHGRLDAGWAYPAAVSGALDTLMPREAALLSSPNNTLAVCYLRAMLRLDARITPVLIPRKGSYHDDDMGGEGFASAGAVRGAVWRGDWQGAESAMPEAAYAVLRREALAGRVMRQNALDEALLYRLRTMTREEWQALPGLSEGIEDRLRRAAQTAASRDALLAQAKTRRYPYARLSRLCTHALLHMTQDMLDDTPLPPAAWLLGLRAEAAPLTHELKRRGLRLLSKAADADRDAAWFRLENRAYDLWCLGARLPGGMALRQGVTVR